VAGLLVPTILAALTMIAAEQGARPTQPLGHLPLRADADLTDLEADEQLGKRRRDDHGAGLSRPRHLMGR
jgi:hypothetical protein